MLRTFSSSFSASRRSVTSSSASNANGHMARVAALSASLSVTHGSG
jgi:hypothetical protein